MAPDTVIVFSIPIPEDLPWPELSPAERASVELALQGLSNAAIGEQRNVAPNTVARQLESAYRKLGVQSRGELAALAISGDTARRTPR
jgi:DNA-binding CsgD family transcriptional regulator